ncbi:MAG: hypothetical protein IJ813_07100 [Bacteroidales bacterium]|nr:hypothetical protein [Bacteroidales bacterium]
MTYYSQLLLYYFLHNAGTILEEPEKEYPGLADETEAAELSGFVKEASAGGLVPPPPHEVIRITRGYRIYYGGNELKLRPMSKAVMLLFLRHPEGIALKDIGDHREELTRLYSGVARTDNPVRIAKSIGRVLDIFSNELNVNLSRVNAALSALENEGRYHMKGRAGEPRALKFSRVIVIWE